MAFIEHLVDAFFEARDQGLGKLALLSLRFLVLNQLALQLILSTLSPDFCVEIADEVISSKQVVLEVVFDNLWELMRVLLCIVQSILHELAQFLVVVLRVFERARTTALGITTNCLAHEARFSHGESLGLLMILFLQISMLVVVNGVLAKV